MTNSNSDPEPRNESLGDTYLVGGAGLSVQEASGEFWYSNARGFQQDSLSWIKNESEPVGVLSAPTGGGKTAAIASVAESVDQCLCVYPTNRLISEQAAILEDEFNLDVTIVTGDSLSGHGEERALELLRIPQSRQQDVVVTNPDILQAMIQDLYFSPNDRVMQFYGLFEAAVFDEFHYYSPLAASGILMQIKILSERGQTIEIDSTGEHVNPPLFLLSSATPDNSFVEIVKETLEIPVRTISATMYGLDVPDQFGDYDTTGIVYNVTSDSVSSSRHDPVVSSLNSNQDISTNELRKIETDSGGIPCEVDRFRHPMIVNRYRIDIDQDFHRIASVFRESLPSAVLNAASRGEDFRSSDNVRPRAAIIFNSAAQSNRFQEFLAEEYPVVERVTAKDNGYDTKADQELPEAYAVLNTTSKGEIGLDFDIDRLVMVAPYSAAAFIQRIGRAARQSPAIVDLYGLADPAWPSQQSYPGFLARLSRVLDAGDNPRTVTEEVMGMRAAYALRTRSSTGSASPSVEADLTGFPRMEKWQAFFAGIEEIREQVSGGGFLSPSLNREGESALLGIDAASEGLRSLRGQSISHQVVYPRGGKRVQTEYDLLRAARHYKIVSVSGGGEVILGGGVPDSVLAVYPGVPDAHNRIDVQHGDAYVEERLTELFVRYAEQGNWDKFGTPVSASLMRLFFKTIDLSSVLVPKEILTGEYRIQCDVRTGTVNSITQGPS